MGHKRILTWIVVIGAGVVALGGLFIFGWEKVVPQKNNSLLKPSEKIIGESKSGESEASAIIPKGSLFTGPLPWEASVDFLRFKEKHGELVRMAAFRTVLPDPLPGEEFNVHLAAERLSGTVIQPGEIFSQNQRLGPYTASRGFRKGPTYMGSNIIESYGGGVCKIASTLYNVVVYSNLQVIERHPHGMTVPYVPPGQDATVSFGNRDFRFMNNTVSPIIIWSMAEGNTLYISIYGKSTPPKVIWHHRTLNQEQYYPVYRFNPSLPKGEKKVIIPGSNGLTVKSWVTIQKEVGRVEIKDMGISYYRPMVEVIEQNP
ncbi:MAG: VanW family protein [Bacillota bacterium]